MTAPVRIDKWLWAVRVFKTRSQATEACRAGSVKIDGVRVKASRHVQQDEMISARAGGITRIVKVLDYLDRRVSAKEAARFAEDLTPEENLVRPKSGVYLPPPFIRPKGVGRPTKKDRRQLDELNLNEGSGTEIG